MKLKIALLKILLAIDYIFICLLFGIEFHGIIDDKLMFCIIILSLIIGLGAIVTCYIEILIWSYKAKKLKQQQLEEEQEEIVEEIEEPKQEYEIIEPYMNVTDIDALEDDFDLEEHGVFEIDMPCNRYICHLGYYNFDYNFPNESVKMEIILEEELKEELNKEIIEQEELEMIIEKLQNLILDRLDKIDGRLEKIENKVGSIDDTTKETNENIKESSENVSTKLTNIENKAQEISDKIDNLTILNVVPEAIEEPEIVEEPEVIEEQEEIEELEEVEEAEEENEEDDNEEDEEEDEEESTEEESSQAKKMTKKKTFEVRLRLSPEKVKEFFSAITNLYGKYGIKGRMTKTKMLFNKKGVCYGKMSFSSKTLRIHLPLDVEAFDVGVYKQKDLGSVKAYATVPFTCKLKTGKLVKLLLVEIEKILTDAELPIKKRYKEVNYVEAFENNVSHIAKTGYEKYIKDEYTLEEVEALHDDVTEDLLEKEEIEENPNKKVIVATISLDELENKFEGEKVNLTTLKTQNLCRINANYLIITTGEKLSKKLEVIANEFDSNAVKMICLTGGRAVAKVTKK